MTRLHFCSEDEVWTEISSLSSGCERRRAAVSYVTSDAILKFASADLLVLDASEDTVKRGATSARVIKRAIDRGATVYSIDHLHSKVMLFDETLVVGSANISVRSEKQLLESVIITDHSSVASRAAQWIEDLIGQAQLIDDSALGSLLEIEGTRDPIRRTYRELAETHIVFFKQVMAGDVEKYLTRSSTAGTGGGARDLRFSPADRFHPLLSQMLSEPSSDPRYTHGPVLSQQAEETTTTDVELWRPTDSRPNEIRISRFYEVPGWYLSEDDFEHAESNGTMLFYVLEMDIHGTVTAKVLSEEQLTRTNVAIRNHLMELQSNPSHRASIIGAVDVIGGRSVP